MGFTEDKRKEAGSQFVDVGIAEETAVALASGVAVNGGKPFYGVYSSFVQRTFDQVSQDVCINNSRRTGSNCNNRRIIFHLFKQIFTGHRRIILFHIVK